MEERLAFNLFSAVMLLGVALVGAWLPRFLASRIEASASAKGASAAYHIGNCLSAGVMLSAGLCHLLADALKQLAFVGRQFPMACFLCGIGFLVTFVADQVVHLISDGQGKESLHPQHPHHRHLPSSDAEEHHNLLSAGPGRPARPWATPFDRPLNSAHTLHGGNLNHGAQSNSMEMCEPQGVTVSPASASHTLAVGNLPAQEQRSTLVGGRGEGRGGAAQGKAPMHGACVGEVMGNGRSNGFSNGIGTVRRYENGDGIGVGVGHGNRRSNERPLSTSSPCHVAVLCEETTPMSHTPGLLSKSPQPQHLPHPSITSSTGFSGSTVAKGVQSFNQGNGMHGPLELKDQAAGQQYQHHSNQNGNHSNLNQRPMDLHAQLLSPSARPTQTPEHSEGGGGLPFHSQDDHGGQGQGQGTYGHPPLPRMVSFSHSECSGGDGGGHMDVLLGGAVKNLSFATALLLAIALCVHSVLEGMALGAQTNIRSMQSIFIAIAAHKGLAAYALGSSVVESKASGKRFWTVMLLFSAATPVAILIGYALSTVTNTKGASALSALASGTFLYVPLMEIMPREFGTPSYRLYKLGALSVGFGLMSMLAIWA